MFQKNSDPRVVSLVLIVMSFLLTSFREIILDVLNKDIVFNAYVMLLVHRIDTSVYSSPHKEGGS